MKKLAIITSHPIQYHAPWFNQLSQESNFSIRVLYLWDFGITEKIDLGFQQQIQWDIPLLSGYEYEFVPNISSQPGTHHFWGLNNPSLLQTIEGYGPDAVLMMGYNYASFFRFLFSQKSRRFPILFRGDSHRLFPRKGLKEFLRRKFISKIFNRFSAFLYVGKANREYFQYHDVPSHKLFFAPHAVDNYRFMSEADNAFQEAILWKQELGIPEKHQVILFAGKFESKKRPLDVAEAFIQAGLKDVTLLFVGAGHLEKDLRLKASTHPNIRFAPFQNQTLMPRTYAAADVVILASYGGAETWGLAINEAMCMSRAVIVSSHVGCAQDLVQSFKNGLIFPAGDIKALSECLKEALSNRERLHEWGKKSFEIIKGYSYRQTTKGLQEALAHLNI